MKRLCALVVALGAVGASPPGGASAQTGGLIVSPQPGTPDASARTQVSLLGVAPDAIGSVTVTGSRTGAHPGHLAPYAAVQGASFLPDKRFSPGERVAVALQVAGAAPITWSFGVARRPPRVVASTPRLPRASRRGSQRFVSRPDVYPPRVALSGRPSPDGGVLFVAPKLGPGARRQRGQTGAMILDRQGRLVWSTPAAPGHAFYDFRPETLDAAPVLTWWEGRVNAVGVGRGEGVILDDAYHVVRHVRAGNGYSADLHEFLLQPDGTAWMTVYFKVASDLRTLGGRADGALYDAIVQRVDVRTGLVTYEWHGLEQLSPAESYGKPAGGRPYDPFHINSIQPLPDGTMLLSARNASAVYLVDQASGRILWRLGGRRSSFTMGRGARFAWQHDARMQPDGTIDMFDNEASPKVGPRPRGLVLKLDTERRLVSLVAQYVHAGKVLAGSQGNMQRLPNGNQLIGWGAGRLVSEFTAAGHRIFDLRFPAPVDTYRAYRAPWTGHPADPPAVAARRGRGGSLVVFASWNGATDVARWQVLSGPSPDALTPVASALWSGLETAIRVRRAARYVAVQALGAEGTVLGSSPAVALTDRA
jgi:hypothetical protein